MNAFSPSSGYTNIWVCLEITKGGLSWKDDAVKCLVSVSFPTHNKVTKPHISIFKYGGLKARLCTFLKENFRFFSPETILWERLFVLLLCERTDFAQQTSTETATNNSDNAPQLAFSIRSRGEQSLEWNFKGAIQCETLTWQTINSARNLTNSLLHPKHHRHK